MLGDPAIKLHNSSKRVYPQHNIFSHITGLKTMSISSKLEKNQNKYFVKWGYMEDQIFNRYLAYDAGEGEANDLKITFRSIKTRIDKEGKPISNDLHK